jgi:hypothetical protein
MVDYFTRCYLQTDQGIKNLTSANATELAGTDPDYATRDLYNAIALGQFPALTFYIQVMTFDEAEKFRWNPLDVTKVIHLCTCDQFVLFCSSNIFRIIMQSSVQLQIRGFGNLEFRNISGSCIYVTK